MHLWTSLCILVASRLIGLVVSYNQICYPNEPNRNPCSEGYICLNVNPENGYGRCRKDTEVCDRKNGSKDCKDGKKCLVVGENVNRDICIDDDMFCTESPDESGVIKMKTCLITDKERNEGILVKGSCDFIADALDSMGCDDGYRCCFNGFPSGVCLNGDHKEWIPQC